MKIALIGNSDHSIYNYRLELIKRLISEGHKISVISPYGSTIEELKNLGCDFFETEVDRHGTNPIKDFKLILIVRNQILLNKTYVPLPKLLNTQ